MELPILTHLGHKYGFALESSFQILFALNLKIESLAYSSQGATPVNLTFVTDWQTAARRGNVISITLHQVY